MIYLKYIYIILSILQTIYIFIEIPIKNYYYKIIIELYLEFFFICTMHIS